MISNALEAIELAFTNFNVKSQKLIIVPNDEVATQGSSGLICLEDNFDVNDALALIGDVKYVGIVSAEKFNRASLSELIDVLTDVNEATVVRLNTSPVSCKIFYPIPKIGDKLIDGNYGYSYGEGWGSTYIGFD